MGLVYGVSEFFSTNRKTQERIRARNLEIGAAIHGGALCSTEYKAAPRSKTFHFRSLKAAR